MHLYLNPTRKWKKNSRSSRRGLIVSETRSVSSRKRPLHRVLKKSSPRVRLPHSPVRRHLWPVRRHLWIGKPRSFWKPARLRPRLRRPLILRRRHRRRPCSRQLLRRSRQSVDCIEFPPGTSRCCRRFRSVRQLSVRQLSVRQLFRGRHRSFAGRGRRSGRQLHCRPIPQRRIPCLDWCPSLRRNW